MLNEIFRSVNSAVAAYCKERSWTHPETKAQPEEAGLSTRLSNRLGEAPQSGFGFGKAVVAVDVARGDVARGRDDPRAQVAQLGGHLIQDVAQEAMLDAHAERPATDRKPDDLAVDDHG